MSRTIERAYPLVIAACVGLALLRLNFSLPLPSLKEFLAAAISLGAILTGFIATAMAILTALPSDSVMGRLRNSGYIDDLMTYLAESLYGCLLFCVYCLAGFFLLEKTTGCVVTYYPHGWIFLATYSLLAFHRVVHILMKIVRHTST
jgi:hypothetical protein